MASKKTSLRFSSPKPSSRQSDRAVQNRYLIGDIAAGLILIDGPGGRQLQHAAQLAIVDQLNRALDFLTQAEPRAALRFRQIHRTCHLTNTDLVQSPSGDRHQSNDETLENIWLTPAMRQLGCVREQDYLSQVLEETQCRQGFLVLVNKFPLPHFAYSIGARVTLSYYAGGFGIANLHALLVHEICHVFGAADEAGECCCDRRFGHLNVVNGNCAVCNPNPQPCIMAGTDLALCTWTRRQIGWDDSLLRVGLEVGNPGN